MVWSRAEEEREKNEGIFLLLKKKKKKKARKISRMALGVCGRVRVADRVKGVKRGG